jgi:sugar/nucleoside kinase (ribokinase family)
MTRPSLARPEHDSPSFDILVVGGVGIDTIVRVPSLPLALADSIHVGPVRDYVAHTGNGVALASLALGRKVKLIDFIGADRQAEMIHARYAERALDFSYLVHPSGTRRSVNLVDPGGRRLSLYDGRHPDDLSMPREFYLPWLEKTRHVHLSIMPWACELYDDIDQLGLTVSTDLHDWDGRAPYYHDFAYRSDIVFMSAANLKGRVEATMRDVLNRGRAAAVVAMNGAEGSHAIAREDGRLVSIGCADLGQPIVDSNGAGDAYVAAFLAGYAQGLPLRHCMRMGAVGGEYACALEGTAEGFVSRAELRAYLGGD